MRVDPLSVRCSYCAAKPGEACVNRITGEPLQKWPAHVFREVDAQRAQQASKDNDSNDSSESEPPW